MTPAYFAAVAYEEENRTLSALGLARELLGRPMRALTWRQVAELTLANNAFIVPREPKRDDVQFFLWRLDPHFTRPDGSMPNWPASRPRPSRLARARARFLCWWISRRATPNKFEPFFRAWVKDAYQDDVADAGGENSQYETPLRPKLTWCDFLQGFFADKNVIGDAFLDLSVGYSLQIYRLHLISIGRAELLDPPSAALFRAPPPEPPASEPQIPA